MIVGVHLGMPQLKLSVVVVSVVGGASDYDSLLYCFDSASALAPETTLLIRLGQFCFCESQIRE